MNATILFQSDDLIVRQVGDPSGKPTVVTFDCFGDWHGQPDRPGFGEAFLAARGVPAFHVLPRGNDWYQYDTTLAALAAIRAAAAPASRIVTYGSSMGGYAAVRFAGQVGAQATLALSPQYSANPAKVPFEHRWPQEGRSITWRPELDGPIACGGIRPILIYDGVGEDPRHARLIDHDCPSDHIALPYAGHPVGTFLLERGLLQPLVLSVLDGSFVVEDARRTLAQVLPHSFVYWSQRAREQRWWGAWAAVRYARRAVVLAPDNALALFTLATSLDRMRRHAEARPLHERAAALSNRMHGYLRPYSFSRAAAGDWAGALALAREVVAQLPDSARAHHWEAWLLGRMGQRDAALAALDRAIALDADNAAYAPLRQAIVEGRDLHPHRPHRRMRR